MIILSIDIGGSHVKMRVSSSDEKRRFDSGPDMTPSTMIENIKQETSDWSFDAVSIGYPGVVAHGRIVCEPRNLGTGWVGFDFAAALSRPVKIINDAAMQALGSYDGGRMLFLGLGTGLGSAMIVDGRVEPMELAHLPYRKGRTYEGYLGSDGLERLGESKWTKHVWAVVDLLRHALEAEYVVLGGGNARRLIDPPAGVHIGTNASSFLGGFQLWDGEEAPVESVVAAVPTSLGMIGLGRMGANMVRRLNRAGHGCVVFDRSAEAVSAIEGEGATASTSMQDLVRQLPVPRSVWLMVPAAVVGAVIEELSPHLEPGDTIVDGGNSYYVDDIRRSEALGRDGIHYLDVGTSGGVWGLERGYCLMIGGDTDAVERLQPVFAALSPPIDSVAATPGRRLKRSTADHGYLHCGPSGAGHFVKMVHNGIEYGLMASYAEGFNLLHHANIGATSRAADAETTPLRDPHHFQFDLDVAEIAELWRRGSVIGSWLLDLTAGALLDQPDLGDFTGHVSDSGEGRWTIKAAVDASVPTPVLSAALYQRFSSRGEADYADKLLSAMRAAFGGHKERS